VVCCIEEQLGASSFAMVASPATTIVSAPASNRSGEADKA
jgi:hypothetical protein